MEFLLANLPLLPWLALLGLCVGFLTGLFGIGGAFITTPVLMALVGLEASLAVGCSMGFTLVNGLLGLRRHHGLGNTEPWAMWPIALAACIGTLVGGLYHYSLKESWGDQFDSLVNGMFVVILVPIGLLVWWQSDKETGRPLASSIKLPPMATLRQKDLPPVSLVVFVLVGLTIGSLKGVLGIGGGIILVPILVLAIGMSPRRAIGTSLGMVVLSSAVGVILFASRGDVNFLIVLVMLAGSLAGVVLGTRFCNISSPTKLKRMLAILILCFTLFLGYQLAFGSDSHPDSGPDAKIQVDHRNHSTESLER